MLYVMCSIRDTAAEVYGQPFFAASKAAAIRMFSDAVNNPEPSNLLGKHPDDFHLYMFGYYDDGEGSFELNLRPEQLIRGVDCHNGSQKGV